ncbi:hypothetical protein DBR28_05580 [Chryseobacterium sp. HMWF028]|nr:hypothetical protein DBR28_05580 [Chryseobacterium sp. HMWF028]
MGVGINTVTPGTALDVNGAITNRETAVAVAGNAATVPANVSQIRLTGAATATVTITAPAAPNAGQRLVVFNNTTGGFGAALNGVTIPNGKALEYVYSNSGWRSTDGGSVGAAAVNIYTADGTLAGNRLVTQGANTLAFTGSQTNAFSVDGSTLSVDAANDRLGIGTTTPDTKLTVSTPDNSFGLNHTNGTVNLKTFIGGGVASVGTTTANDLRLMTNNSQKVTVTSVGNVGIGTVSPTAQLQTTGNMILGTANSTNGAAGYSTLSRDNTTGEVRVMSSSTGNTFAFNYLTYQINNVDLDWISDFNTNIPISQYTLAIIGSSFDIGAAGLNSNFGTFAPLNVYAFQSGGTWRLSADYRNAGTSNGANGNWTIYVLVINNSIIKPLSTVTVNLGGTTIGSAGMPAGL